MIRIEKRDMLKAIIVILTWMFVVMAMMTDVDAKTVKRYSTQTINLRKKAKGKVIRKIKRNTRVYQIRSGKRWSVIKYKGKRYVTLKKHLSPYRSPRKYTGAYFKRAGVIHWRGYKFTWYSQRILPDYNNNLGIKGKHIDGQGFICDKDNYICLGSNTSNRGKIIATPFGKFGKVYDAGYVTTDWFDCYVDW